MENKQQIQKLRDYAELAMSAYGYFHLVGKKFNDNDLKKTKIAHNPTIAYTDILDLTYRGYETADSTFFNPEKLDGDFSPNQAKRFFEKYDLLIHQPNTSSGFSASLFQEKETKEYTLAIRGTTPSDTGDLKADARIALGHIPQGQYEDMMRFYNQCVEKYPIITRPNSLNITGHSLGGALTQLFALSFNTNTSDKDRVITNEVYTYNNAESKKVA